MVGCGGDHICLACPKGVSQSRAETQKKEGKKEEDKKKMGMRRILAPSQEKKTALCTKGDSPTHAVGPCTRMAQQEDPAEEGNEHTLNKPRVGVWWWEPQHGAAARVGH